MSACRNCGAPVIWATETHSKTGVVKNVPLDAEATGGDFDLEEGEEKPRAVWVGKGRGQYTKHFQTCTQKEQRTGPGIDPGHLTQGKQSIGERLDQIAALVASIKADMRGGQS